MKYADFDPNNNEKKRNEMEENNYELNEPHEPIENEDEKDVENERDSEMLDAEDYDNYGSSGEKYGWYNGWSDDVIDDAFEGDPENTWNVD